MNLTCQYTISATSDVLNRNYIMTPTFVANTGTPQTLSSITLAVTGAATPTAGNLSIILDSQVVGMDESITATVIVSGSVDVSGLSVSVASADSNILSVTPTSCVLSTDNNSCQVTINGVSSGAGYIIASASEYLSFSSGDIWVSSNVVPDNLSIALESANLSYGESTLATITLNDSYNVESLLVNVASSDTDVAATSSSSCNLSTTSNTCSVVVTAGSETNVNK